MQQQTRNAFGQSNPRSFVREKGHLKNLIPEKQLRNVVNGHQSHEKLRDL